MAKENKKRDGHIPVTQNLNQISINAESAYVGLNANEPVNEPLIGATLFNTPLRDKLLFDKFLKEVLLACKPSTAELLFDKSLKEVPLVCKPSRAELLVEKPFIDVSLVDKPFLAKNFGQLNTDDITGTKNPTHTSINTESVAGHSENSCSPENNSLPGSNLYYSDFGRTTTRVVNHPKNWRWDYVDRNCCTIIINGKDFVNKIVLLSRSMLTFFEMEEKFFPLFGK